ncbi:glycosyltransferase family 4 protein [Gloeobacter kilaueensis]|uniref:Glycosyl transferase group 1 n=1 Tax=Gloeobacter kilaueensis (strain ATCC BAA-2537 / CCAP 1431/1 / ULC 316 / JS1) TaxID=1183438 RepID=U5QLA7_GLOK1|nr:glycosyltransferase family 1 protein [Gloeobacter kilaueensis]AGY59716.1 glycosyl transferase group 1 [Gloeobacter kilaueensis JS1]
MRVLYDGAIYNFQSHGGIRRYFDNLFKQLAADYSLSLYRCHPQIPLARRPHLRQYTYRYFRPRRLSSALEPFFLRGLLGTGRFDLLHPTYYSYSPLIAAAGRERLPIVLTVWDLIHERFPDQAGPTADTVALKQKILPLAQRIICISESTKADLIEIYKIPEKKISVTYLATDLNAALALGDEPVPERPYFLYVGSRLAYKNFDRLLVAFAQAFSAKSDPVLCVVGAPAQPAEQERIAALGLTGRVEFYPYPDDRHLAKLYHRSLALVYPSLYEGFGIPPLEAMACETAVIASNRSSLPEVVGDAGILINPLDIAEWTDALRQLATNPQERTKLIERGSERVKHFSWQKTAAQTLAVYQLVGG